MSLHRLGCGARNRATMLAKVAQPPVAHPIAISCTPTTLYTLQDCDDSGPGHHRRGRSPDVTGVLVPAGVREFTWYGHEEIQAGADRNAAAAN
jgi:hypothetical protein